MQSRGLLKRTGNLVHLVQVLTPSTLVLGVNTCFSVVTHPLTRWSRKLLSRMLGICGSVLGVFTGLLSGASGSSHSHYERGDVSFFEGSASLSTQWSTAFEQTAESKLAKGKLLTTIPALGREWRVSLEVSHDKLNHRSPQGLRQASVFHMIEDIGTKLGKYTPAIWVHRGRILVSSAFGEKPIFNKVFLSQATTLGNWTQIIVSQSLQGQDYIYAIKIGGKEVLSMINTRPRLFYDVKVYAGSPLFAPLDGSIRQLKIEVGEEQSLPMTDLGEN